MIAERKRQRDKREKVSAFSLFYCRLSEVVKNVGLLCGKVTLKFVWKRLRINSHSQTKNY